MFVLIPLIILGVPWIIMRSRMFQMRMTSYRALRFNFHGTYGGAMAAFIGWYLLAVLTLGALFPYWIKKRVAVFAGQFLIRPPALPVRHEHRDVLQVLPDHASA